MSKEIDVIIAKSLIKYHQLSKGKKIVKQTIEMLYNERTVEVQLLLLRKF